MPPGKQRFKRTRMVLPLRLWPEEDKGQNAAPQLAHTVDISPIGGRLGGLRCPLQPGQTVMLQRGQSKVPFRVIWTQELGPGEIQAGVESTAYEEKVWGVDLPDEPMSAGMSLAHSKTAAPAPEAQSDTRRARPRPRWMALVAGALSAVVLAAVAGYWILGDSKEEATISLPANAPAAIVPVVLGTPRPYGNVRVVFSKRNTDADSDSSRLQVAEAPQGRVIYPDAPDSNLTGTVGMKAVIATDGKVKEIHVLSGNRTLAEAAVQAVRFWHYTRHELNGEAVEAETNVKISFHGDAVNISFPSTASNNNDNNNNNDGLGLKNKVSS
jgi:outer membrane biosynthesis protein TonB